MVSVPNDYGWVLAVAAGSALVVVSAGEEGAGMGGGGASVVWPAIALSRRK